LVLLLCGVAAIRVFVFAAAFPFFNNVDEQAHFDLVVKYSHGEIPRGLERTSSESARYIALYGSPEYLLQPEQFPGGRFPPPLWMLPANEISSELQAETTAWQSVTNHETSEPPLYYALAASWLRLGRAGGLTGGFLLYWIRFLNVPLAALLVWLGFVAARLVVPERFSLRLGVPMLLAVFPQDTFYGIQSDALSPICFGLAFIGLLRLWQADAPRARLGALTGLAIAATCLTKTANLPLLAVAVAAVLFKTWLAIKSGKWRTTWLALASLLLCAALLITAWFAWNRHTFGDITGSTVKIEFLGWTLKPFNEWWHHPIFTPIGAGKFWSELLASLWRGEFVWFGQPLASAAVSAFYWISSTLLLGAAVVNLFPKFSGAKVSRRRVLWLAFLSFAALIGFLALLSISFDFGKSFYPSRENPYFVSGRLLNGALIPFSLLYVFGLDRALSWWKSDRLRLLALAGIALFVAISQIAINAPAFFSQYNWFHLWTAPS